MSRESKIIELTEFNGINVNKCLCGCIPFLIESYDTLTVKIRCPKCGKELNDRSSFIPRKELIETWNKENSYK